MKPGAAHKGRHTSGVGRYSREGLGGGVVVLNEVARIAELG